VRNNFAKVTKCQTAALGGRVYASDLEEKLSYNTCKSRTCPTCGQRATDLWQRQQLETLPDVPYTGMVFTMPQPLWPIFRQNRALLHDLPVLGAQVVQQWAKMKYGVRLFIIVVPHTFGRHLNFNAHLHILVSAGGLLESRCRWIARISFDRKALMHMWRYAVITFLRQALKHRLIRSDLSVRELETVLRTQYERWWNIHISRVMSKQHFLRYAGRYVRRLPIAERRLMAVSDTEVRFWTKDTRSKQIVVTQCSLDEFVRLLAQHVPDHYRHNIRHFGLSAPNLKRRISAALFLQLAQEQRRPRRPGWAYSIRRHFGTNPLVDSRGHTMRCVRYITPLRM